MCMQFNVMVLITLFTVLFFFLFYDAVIIFYHGLDNLIAGKYHTYISYTYFISTLFSYMMILI